MSHTNIRMVIWMNKIKYTPCDEVVEIVRQDLAWDEEAEYITQLVRATMQQSLASLFATIARCEAHESDDVTFPITEEGEFTDDFKYAVIERIHVHDENRNKFFFLLAGDLYDAIMTKEIGGEWGFLDYSNGEIFVVIKLRRPTPTPRPDWVKAELV